MKQVTFTRDMAPHTTGDKRVVPDDVAARLVADGDVTDVHDFPGAGTMPAEEHRPAGRYRMKGKGR